LIKGAGRAHPLDAVCLRLAQLGRSRSFNRFAQYRHQEPKFTRSGPACRGRSGCVLDNFNQMPNALDESFADYSMIEIVQFDAQTDLPRLRNRWVAKPR
jgi:hypothetical protein